MTIRIHISCHGYGTNIMNLIEFLLELLTYYWFSIS